MSASGWANSGESRLTDRVWAALGIQSGEKNRVFWAGTLFFVVLASASIGLNAADTLFFVRFGVDSLPWMIMASGLVVMIATIAYAAGLAAFGAFTWSWTVPAVLAGWLAAERLAIPVEPPGIYPVVWLTGQVAVYVGFTLLWDVAGGLCDTRQAKRIFPILMSAGIAGSVTGNALTGPLAGLLGTENLLVVQAIGFGVAGVIGKVTTQRFFAPAKAAAGTVLRDLRAGLTTTVRVPLFRLVAGVGAAMSLLFFLVFFPFSEVAAASFETEEALAGFLGTFSSLATAATFAVSLLVANRLFARWGVVTVLLIVALVYVAGFSAWLVSFGLLTATLFRGVQWVAINALGGTAFSSLFNVLTGRRRSQVRDFVSAVPVQVGTVLGGAVLLVGASLPMMGRLALSLAIALGFVLLVIPMRTAYAAALVDAVRRGMSDVLTAPLPGMQKPAHNADTVAALLAATGDARPGRRRISAAMLGEVGGEAASAALARLIGDEDATVRLAALESLAALDRVAATEHASHSIGDPSVRVRRFAIALLGPEHATNPTVVAALRDQDAEVRAHAARIVGGPAGRSVIDTMLELGDGEAIAAALECLAAEPALADADPRQYVDDPDRRVRAAAAGLLGAYPDGVRSLRALLDDRSPDVRLTAARALCDTDREQIHAVLDEGSVRARESALRALVEGSESDEELRAWAERQLDRAGELHRFRMALEKSETASDSASGRYLMDVLERRERIAERWVVTALGTGDTMGVLTLVARGAISGEPETRAGALEAIESLTDRTLARRLVSLMESPADRIHLDRLDALEALAGDSEYWLRALGARTIFEELSGRLERTVSRAADDPTTIVGQAIPAYSVRELDEGRGITTFDAVLALQQASILGHLDPEDLEMVAATARQRSFAPNEVVYELGSLGDEFLMIVGGGAIVEMPGAESGNEFAELGPGEPVGELSVLRQQPRMATVVAGQDGLIALVIAAQDFLRLLEEQPDMAIGLMAKLAERIAHAVDRSHNAGVGAPDRASRS